MDRTTRRTLLGRAAGAAAATALPFRPLFAAGAQGPEGIVGVAVAGVKGRGGNHVQAWLAQKDVHVAGICDIDPSVAGGVLQAVEKKQGKPPRFETEWRRLLEDRSIDAVSIATCNHTHTLLAIWAMQAGKHVYVEKPLSHTVWEGRKLIEAARRYGRVVQHGTQKRSLPETRRMAAFLRAGGLGKIRIARCLCYNDRGGIGRKDCRPVPPDVNYDGWLGPAPVLDWMRDDTGKPGFLKPNRFHYNWHWYWDTGNGDIGNQAVHEMDLIRWYAGANALPKRVTGVGGRFAWDDDGETFNTQVVCYEYDDLQMIFELRNLRTDRYRGEAIGLLMECDKGHANLARAFDAAGKGIPVSAPDDGRAGCHFRNFIEAVKAGQPERANAGAADGHLSSALCHLGNVSCRLGEPVALDSREDPFPGNDAGNDAFRRMVEHLKEHGIAPSARYLRGRALTLDPEAERFATDPEADRLLTREYRKPYVVPEHA